MGSVTVNRHINAPPQVVYDMITDLPSAPQRVRGITRIEMLTDGPFRVGTRWRETRLMFKKEATEEMEVTAVDPPRSYTVAAESCGARYETHFRVKPDGSGSLLEFQMTWKAVSLLAKLMSPLGFLMAGMARKCVEKDLDDIKRAAEGGSSMSPAPAT